MPYYRAAREREGKTKECVEYAKRATFVHPFKIQGNKDGPAGTRRQGHPQYFIGGHRALEQPEEKGCARQK